MYVQIHRKYHKNSICYCYYYKKQDNCKKMEKRNKPDSLMFNYYYYIIVLFHKFTLTIRDWVKK